MEQIRLSDFKIVPIIDSVRREEISDEVYFSKAYSKYISNSSMGYINPSQNGSLDNYTHPPRLTTQSLNLGSCVHQITLQNEEFNLAPKCNKPSAKLGATLDKIIYYRKHGESIYDSIIKASADCNYYVNQIDNKIKFIIKSGLKYYLTARNFEEGTITLSNSDWDKCNTCIQNVKNNMQIQKLLHPKDEFMDELPSFNEDVLFLDVLVVYKDRCTTLKLKMKADNWTIDEDRKELVLNDLKTTSHNLDFFMSRKYDGSFYHYHYYRQLALYSMILEKYCILKYGFNKSWTTKCNILAVNTVNFDTRVFNANKVQLLQGKQEYERLLKMIAYYEIFGYDQEVEFVKK